MKYLKSFLGTLILLLLISFMMIPVIVVSLLSVFVSHWFLFGEIIVIPIIMLAVGKLVVSNKLAWILGLMSAVFNE